MATMVKRKC